MPEKNPVMLLELLFDEQQFTETGKYADSSIIAGFGEIGASLVYAYEQNISVKSGAVSKNAAVKM
ncbi:MAG: hypothetical protein FWG44_09010, partial [Oscillospiraceae bacterium]|nr:hypothetical protein [Oscillospiraceae bacterium]